MLPCCLLWWQVAYCTTATCSSAVRGAGAPKALTAAEELLEIIMRRYERTSTMLTSNRPVEDWGKLLGDAADRGTAPARG